MSKPVSCVDQKPLIAGEYNISIRGVHTFLPIFANFNGIDWNWIEIDRKVTSWGLSRSDVFWYPENAK